MSYPTTPSYATPKKRRLEDGQGSASASANATPSSLRGALTGIRSWLSPWRGNSRTSAAFGQSPPSASQDAEDERRQDESSQTLYPPIPSHATMPALNRRESPPPPLPFTFTPPTHQTRDEPPVASSSSSPLSRNYSLLARFFAEKAAEEAGTSTGADDDGNRLTEDEVEGCRILIEESGRSPGDLQRRMGLASEEQDSFEVPKRRLAAAPRRPRGTGSWLSPSPAAHSVASREGSALSFDRSPLARGFGSASASVLSHSMTDPGLSRRAQLPTSASANPFLSGRTSSAQPPARRRRRPLYFGPGMSSTASPFAATSAAPQTRPAATTFTGAGKRQRVDDDVPPSTSIAQAWQPPPADWPLPSLSRPTQPPRNAPAASPTAQPARAAEASQPSASAPQSSPAQSRTASAVLSILAQPDLARPAPMPVRRSTRAATSNSNQASTSASTAFRPDGILNPYQASPELNLGQSSQSSMRRSRTSEAVAKMKDERRRSTRLRKSAAPEDSSAGDTSAGLLETIERTKPGGSSSSAARRSGTGDSSYATPTPEPPRITFAQPAPSPSPSPSPSTGKTAAEKTAEAKQRLDAMSAASSDASSSSKPSGSESLSAPARQAPATPPSFNFGKHAPPKPSRLSIAFNANDSPGNTETADEEEEEAEERVTGEDSNMSMDIKTSQPVASAKSTFTFGGAMSKQSGGAASSGSGTTSKQNDGTSGSSQPASAKSAIAESNTTKTTPSFSFGLPAATAPSPPTPASATSRPASSSSSSTPREAALTTEAAALPKFDLQVSLSASTPSWYARSATTEEEQRRTKASSAPISELPSFDLLREGEPSGGANGQSLTSKDEQRREKASATSVAALPTFNLFGNGASAPPATSAPDTSSTASAAGEGAGEEGSSSSALLGSGEGEEGETTVFEVRAKFWKFSGKWEDLGVGIARIKRSSTTAADQAGSPRRLLVRNAGNGAVTVNFNLFRDFKAAQTGTTLSFTGFDAEGKGQPMRCKVKTAESAEEFAQALEGEAKLS